MRLILILFSCCFLPAVCLGQSGRLNGTVSIHGDDIELEYATVVIPELNLGSTTDETGKFSIEEIPFGTYEVSASYIGYKSVSKEFTLSLESNERVIDFLLNEKNMELDELVVTGTKTFKRQTNSPNIVFVTNSESLENVQACNLSEGLKFQPGLRVETNCQTCNYTQLRMNGLAGGYSQILINGRPIFSPLTGLYGMEQLPVNMIDRIEVLRGGGSSLYGSSAIGGTVNIITKIPKRNSYELNYNYHNINGQANDHQLMGNATIVSTEKNAGMSVFMNYRNRDFYDDNEDNFSELPQIRNTSFGGHVFFLPQENQKLEISFSNLNEYRFGGEMVNLPAYLTEQSEERTHNVWMASADYQINFKNERTSLINYFAFQNTQRDHYTGILPDEAEALNNHLENPPYGISAVSTYNVGTQVNHRLRNFLNGTNTFTLGMEYIFDDVFDDIPAYNYLIDQQTKNFGAFVQSDWEIVNDLTLLSGLRMDVHNLVDQPVFNPRIALLYKLKNKTQFRLNYGMGFRAPQAFDTDLHIAFAGGGVSRVMLSPDLQPEKSQSFSASVNFDQPTENFVVGFTLEGFYTRLNNAFFLQPIGQDEFGEVFEKRNGQGASVKGLTLELRANFKRKLQIESGFTLQSSLFDEEVAYIDGLPGLKRFIRTPNDYGFITLSIDPIDQISVNFNYVYTGRMKVPHFAGAPNQLEDEIITSESFSEVNSKFAYRLNIEKVKASLEFYAGVKNIFNAYQDQFDIGKNRDSNFVYGPAQPRTYFVGIKVASL